MQFKGRYREDNLGILELKASRSRDNKQSTVLQCVLADATTRHNLFILVRESDENQKNRD
jgi:hypothetical protein